MCKSQILDEIEPLTRDPHAAFRLPVMEKYKDMGTMVMGKSEAGVVQVGDKLRLMPNKNVVKVRRLPCSTVFPRLVSAHTVALSERNGFDVVVLP